MKKHSYLTKINNDQWTDIQRIGSLMNKSANVIINEGIRLAIRENLQNLSILRKNRSSLEGMVGV